jgi:long-subunit fatty acid transport protein
MLNYMQSISESLSAGYSMAFVPQHNRSIFSFGAKYNPNPQTTVIGAYNPTHP